MTKAIKERGETPFPEAGEGVIIVFRNSDLKRVEGELGASWFNQILEAAGIGTISFEMFEILLEHGAKTSDRVPVKVDVDDISGPFHNAVEKMVDAICVSVKGKSFKDYMEEMFKAMEAASESEVPLSLSPDTTNSTISDDDASGPVSE